jgi:hypothetical protein
MPYIKDNDRTRIDNIKIIDFSPRNAGELQYVIALFINEYIDRQGLNYQHCNDMLGALSGAQMEFYRKVVAPYEEEKIKSNGSVYREKYSKAVLTPLNY